MDLSSAIEYTMIGLLINAVIGMILFMRTWAALPVASGNEFRSVVKSESSGVTSATKPLDSVSLLNRTELLLE